MTNFQSLKSLGEHAFSMPSSVDGAWPIAIEDVDKGTPVLVLLSLHQICFLFLCY